MARRETNLTASQQEILDKFTTGADGLLTAETVYPITGNNEMYHYRNERFIVRDDEYLEQIVIDMAARNSGVISTENHDVYIVKNSAIYTALITKLTDQKGNCDSNIFNTYQGRKLSAVCDGDIDYVKSLLNSRREKIGSIGAITHKKMLDVNVIKDYECRDVSSMYILSFIDETKLKKDELDILAYIKYTFPRSVILGINRALFSETRFYSMCKVNVGPGYSDTNLMSTVEVVPREKYNRSAVAHYVNKEGNVKSCGLPSLIPTTLDDLILLYDAALYAINIISDIIIYDKVNSHASRVYNDSTTIKSMYLPKDISNITGYLPISEFNTDNIVFLDFIGFYLITPMADEQNITEYMYDVVKTGYNNSRLLWWLDCGCRSAVNHDTVSYGDRYLAYDNYGSNSNYTENMGWPQSKEMNTFVKNLGVLPRPAITETTRSTVYIPLINAIGYTTQSYGGSIVVNPYKQVLTISGVDNTTIDVNINVDQIPTTIRTENYLVQYTDKIYDAIGALYKSNFSRCITGSNNLDYMIPATLLKYGDCMVEVAYKDGHKYLIHYYKDLPKIYGNDYEVDPSIVELLHSGAQYNLYSADEYIYLDGALSTIPIISGNDGDNLFNTLYLDTSNIASVSVIGNGYNILHELSSDSK